MKRIVSGRTYNTKTATLVNEWGVGYGGDNDKYDERIYVTKSGRWFRAGSGGPASHYAVREGNAYTGGYGLIPLTEDEALSILEGRNAIEAIETHLAHRIEEA
jgi:hypothetical protein